MQGATRNPIAEAPADLEMVADPDPRRVSDASPAALVHAVTVRRRDQLREILCGATKRRDGMVHDHVARFESLMDNPRDELNRRFPSFHKALVLVTDWRYRLLSLMAVLWEITITLAEDNFCTISAQTAQQSLLNKLSGFNFAFTQLVLLLLIPWVYTGSLLSAGVKDDMNYQPADVSKPGASFGFYRLLECQLRLLGEEHGAPNEGRVSKFFVRDFPICYFSFWCLIMLFYVLDALAGTSVMKTPFCKTRAQTEAFIGMHLFMVVDILCWSLPLIGVVVGLFGLHLGCAMCSSELTGWIERYRCMKDATPFNLPPGAPSVASIRRDAFERYLLVHKVFVASSRIWTTFLCVFFLLTLLGAILYFVFVVKFSGEMGFIFWYLWLYLLLYLSELTLPIFLIAQANSPHRFLAEMFVWSVPTPGDEDHERTALLFSSPATGGGGGGGGGGEDPIPPSSSSTTTTLRQLYGPGDFSLIGGRKEWLAFLAQAPIRWTVGGVPITYEKLSAVVASAALSVVVSVLPKIFQQFAPST